ncbi:hypothetical protein WH390_11415 [Candidatus Arsenophonus nilaparvatae]|uniref:hypothetical protein n=1 Tax=Candidatus Arsenophonus nilaparvatae TaxID=1247023 RepID=UPI0005097C3F|nr:hypothetical protein [Candidatus Arsenophonus nilaparvatae]
MTILTVYFCGTGVTKFEDSNKQYWQGELVSMLASNNLGREFAEWIIIDGPGSGNLQQDELWVKDGGYHNWTGVGFGKGWKENVQHAIHIIKGNFDWQREKLTEKQYNLLKKANIAIDDVEVSGSYFWRHYDYGNRKVSQQQLQQQIIKMYRKGGVIPSQVNIVGWSRGGVSCHMLANAMLEDELLKEIPVNIFAIDPVPGPLNFQNEKVSLGKNVKEYVAFYAKDERSKGFCCVIPKTDSATIVRIFPMRGRHATLVGNASLDSVGEGKVLYQPGLIVRHFAEVCLTRWGVKLDKKLELSDRDLLELHQSIAKNSDLYQDIQNYSYTQLTEKNGNERNVSYGDEGSQFSLIRGNQFLPESGLISDFLVDPLIYDGIK